MTEDTEKVTHSMLIVATQQGDIILPGAAELVWGGIVFFVVATALVVGAVVLVVRRGNRRAEDTAVQQWRERALRAEAQLELLTQERKDA